MEKKYELYTCERKVLTPYGIQVRAHVKSPLKPTSPHFHNYYEIHLLPEKGLLHKVNNSQIDLPKGSLVFIRPNDRHEFYNYSHSDKNSMIYAILIKKEVMESVFEFLSPELSYKKLLESELPPYAILNHIECSKLENKIKHVNSIDQKATDEACLYLKKVLINVFVDYFQTRRAKLHNPEETIPIWLLNTVDSMKSVENFVKGTEQMVKLSGKTLEHLCRSMKKYYNTTPSNFINDLRLTYIANILLNSDLSIADACFESGFQNISWMNVKFKEKFGVTPSQYRQKASPIKNATEQTLRNDDK